MIKTLLASVAALAFVVGVGMASPAEAGTAKVRICHFPGHTQPADTGLNSGGPDRIIPIRGGRDQACRDLGGKPMTVGAKAATKGHKAE